MENAAGYGDWVVLAKAFATLKDMTAYLVSSGEKKAVIFFKKVIQLAIYSGKITGNSIYNGLKEREIDAGRTVRKLLSRLWWAMVLACTGGLS